MLSTIRIAMQWRHRSIIAAPQITSIRLYVQLCVQTDNNEDNKAPHYLHFERKAPLEGG